MRGYLSDPADVRKRFQLSSQIANLFDQYLVFRPDLILAWDQGLPGTAALKKTSMSFGRRRFGDRLQQEQAGAAPGGAVERVWRARGQL